MRTMLRRMVALLAMAVLGGTGVALATAWSPTAGLVAPAAAGDDDDDGGRDDDGGQVPAGGVDTGLGGAAGDDDDDDAGDDDGRDDDGGDDDGRDDDGAGGDDDGGDDDSGQVPVGGVQTGFGGTAETVSSASEPANGLVDVAKAVAPAAAVGLGGYALLRARAARSDGAA